MRNDFEIVCLTKKMLSDFVKYNTLWKNDLAPMSRSKALWLVSNERIDEDDYCGILAYEGKKMVSFIYMIPDIINTGTESGKKAYWIINWWVIDKYKDTILGTYIYNQALKVTERQALIKAYTKNVEPFYNKQPFTIIASRLRHTLFFSLDSSMLIGKFRFLKSLKFILDTTDAVISRTIRYINKNKLGCRTKNLKYDYLNQIDQDTWNFIKPLCENDLILKTFNYVNWQLDSSQYLQLPISKRIPYENLQTGISNNIQIHKLKIILNDKIIGFLSHVINYNEFNVKYFLVEDEEYYDKCVDALMENLIQSKRNFMFTDDNKLSKNIKKRYFTLFIHKVLKKGLAHNDIQFNFDNVTMFNRDGHFY